MRSSCSHGAGRCHVCVGFAAVMSIAAGCTTGSSSVTRQRQTLTLYASAPPGAANTQSAADVLDGRAAGVQSVRDASVGKFTLGSVKLHGAKASDNARTRDRGHQLDRLPRRARSRPVGGFAGDHQRAGPAAGHPDRHRGRAHAGDLRRSRTHPTATTSRWAPTGGRSPGWCPTRRPRPRRRSQEMQAQHVSKLYVSSDGSQYGKAIAQAVRTDAPASSITIAPVGLRRRRGLLRRSLGRRRREGVQLGGRRPTRREAVRPVGARHARRSPPRLSPAARNVYISSPGLPDQGSERHGQERVRQALRGPPTTSAGAPGDLRLRGDVGGAPVLKKAGTSATDRATVVKDFFAIKNRDSVLGHLLDQRPRATRASLRSSSAGP